MVEKMDKIDKIIEVLLKFYIETTNGERVYPFEELKEVK